jgi:hypothetical protein
LSATGAPVALVKTFDEDMIGSCKLSSHKSKHPRLLYSVVRTAVRSRTALRRLCLERQGTVRRLGPRAARQASARDWPSADERSRTEQILAALRRAPALALAARPPWVLRRRGNVSIQFSPSGSCAKTRRRAAVCTVKLLSSIASPGHALSISTSLEIGWPASETFSN